MTTALLYIMATSYCEANNKNNRQLQRPPRNCPPHDCYCSSDTNHLGVDRRRTCARWVIVTQDVRGSPPFLKSPYGVGTWKVDTMGKAFRFLRLRSTGVNGRCVSFDNADACWVLLKQCRPALKT